MGTFDLCQKRIRNVPNLSVDRTQYVERTHFLVRIGDVSMEYPYRPRASVKYPVPILHFIEVHLCTTKK